MWYYMFLSDILLLNIFVTHGKDLLTKPLLLPHNCQPGYRITSIPFWGQSFSISENKPAAKYFSVTSTGDVITNSDIANLLGQHITLLINNDLATEQWTEEVQINIGDGNDILQFSQNQYNGVIKKNVPPGSVVSKLDYLFAYQGVMFDEPISYILKSNVDVPFELQHDTSLLNAAKIVTTQFLEKSVAGNYEMRLEARSKDDSATTTITIRIISDNEPKFLAPEYHVVISENTPAMTTITQLRPLNLDFKGRLYFSMKSHGLFKIQPNTGHVILRSHTLLEPLTYYLHVRAEDITGVASPPATVVIEVETTEDDTLLRYTPHSELSPHSRQRRAIRETKKFEVPESLSGELIRLSDDSHERFAFADTPPVMLEINRQTGAVRLRDGYHLDYEDTPNIHFSVIITKTNNRKGEYLKA